MPLSHCEWGPAESERVLCDLIDLTVRSPAKLENIIVKEGRSSKRRACGGDAVGFLKVLCNDVY